MNEPLDVTRHGATFEPVAGLTAAPPNAARQTKDLLARLRDLRGSETAAQVRRLAESVPLTEEARARVTRLLDM